MFGKILMKKRSVDMFGLNETRYGTHDMIGWDINGGVEDITLHNLLVEVGLLEVDHNHEELTVVWEYVDQEIHIQEIYDNDSGEMIWRLPEDEAYSEEDEVIMNSLLMWGELESTIM
jgi:hypothetical protein